PTRPPLLPYTTLFRSFIALALALAALWIKRKDRLVRWFAAIAAGGLALSLGKDFPPYWLIYRFVPMVEKAREPAMAIVLFQLAVDRKSTRLNSSHDQI